MATPEGEIKKSILIWLSLQRDCICWPNDSVGIFDPVKKIYRKNKSKFHRNGVSDILGIWKKRFLAIEVKSPTGRLTDDQKKFIDEIAANGGIAFVARSVEDVAFELSRRGALQDPE